MQGEGFGLRLSLHKKPEYDHGTQSASGFEPEWGGGVMAHLPELSIKTVTINPS
jgi:hypothetical protein